MTDTPDLAALIGSRICHDLISPIAAIGNGVELLAMSGTPMTPEMELIASSVAQANARIRFFRVAFGVGGGQPVSKAEVRDILNDMAGRVAVDWAVAEDLTRAQTKTMFLLIQCLESAMAFGGTITVKDARTLRGDARRLRDVSDQWAILQGQSLDVTATNIHFALARAEIAALEGELRIEASDTSIQLGY